jgi:short chain dehydrogenase
MLRTIVVPLDGPDVAAHALPVGIALATAVSTSITVIGIASTDVVALNGSAKPASLLSVAADWALRLHTRLRIVMVYDPVLPEPCPSSSDRGGRVMCTESMLCPVMRPGPLDGCVALVTCPSSGIGAAVASTLAERGATVVVNSSWMEAGEQLASELPAASCTPANVNDPKEVARLVVTTIERHGRLDIVVNTAGTAEVIAHGNVNAARNHVWVLGWRDPPAMASWGIAMAGLWSPRS